MSQSRSLQLSRSNHPTSSSSIKTKKSLSIDPFYDKAYNMAEKLASTSIGQFAITRVDNVLHTFESTAKWAVPPKDGETDDKLERPLSWIPFLAAIITLRTIRVSLSVASMLIGNEPIPPSDVVYFLQTRRRKLRAIKNRGKREIRLRKEKLKRQPKRGVFGIFATLLNKVFCRPTEETMKNDKSIKCVVKKHEYAEKKLKDLLNSANPLLHLNKRKLENNENDENYTSDNELEVAELLDKYAAEGSDAEDPDYVLDENSLSDDILSEESSTEDAIQNKSENNQPEKSQYLITRLIKKKREQIENKLDSIKSTIESQIDEKMEHHLMAMKAKLEEKIEQIQAKHAEKLAETESAAESETQEEPILKNPSSVSINPTKLAPNIAQNGTVENEQSGTDDIHSVSSGSPPKNENNIGNNLHKHNDKKFIDASRFST